MHSPDLTEKNIDKLAELFPTVVTETRDEEGNVMRAIDLDLLRQELTNHVVEGPQERYQLDWPGKREALFAANAPIAKTLRPMREESVDFDTTKNLFIEGDNLDALRLLQESYLGKVKLIYIDPPYNTGSDLVYSDDFSQSTADYLAKSGQTDSGAKLVANTEASGRFHSDWLSMMYPRLRLARNLLRPDGVLLVSMGESEVANLRILLAEVFGSANFVGQLVWEKKKKGAFLSGSVTNVKEYILAVARDRANFPGLVGEVARATETYPVIKTTNARGIRTIRAGILSKYRESNHRVGEGTRLTSGNMEMILKSNLEIRAGRLAADVEIESNWIYRQELLDEYAADGSLYITQDLYFRRVVTDPRVKMLKDLLPMRGEESTGAQFMLGDDLFADGWGTNEDAFDELHELFGAQGVMSFPKPTKLIAKLILSACREDKDAVVLDFFAGSGTTADALMQLNAADGGTRSFLLVQLAERVPTESEAAKAGFDTIAALCRERIRRAGQRLVQDAGLAAGMLDVGFRALKVDTSSMADILRTPDETDQEAFAGLEDSVKPDRTVEDLLFQVLLDWGLELTVPIDVERIEGNEVFAVEGGALIACFDTEVGTALVRKIASRSPLRVVFRDAGFATDADRINAEQVFAEVSPATDVKVI